ncbi:MAG: rhomboid family intramembrane serine protease [Gammaproteobacteria bacterium]|nr:rhomboid family intramembrane serine protease [Gammaproteobacteria bacterium]
MTLLLPGEWVSIHRAMTRRPCEERALVLGAMQIEHVVTEQPDGCHLLVPAASAAAARRELALYLAENPAAAVTPWPAVPAQRGFALGLAFPVLVLLAFQLQSRYAFGLDWTGLGAAVAGSIREGEWWRAATALMLHADAAHAAGNAVFGAFFGYLAGQYVGSGVAAFGVVLAAAAGNVCNAWLQGPGHSSIGASTAVFAALGLVGASVFALSRRHALGWARRWAPVVGAVALLTYTGTGDENTDIVAHLTGFIAGGLAGFAIAALPASPAPSWRWQATAGAAAAVLLVAAWYPPLAGG